MTAPTTGTAPDTGELRAMLAAATPGPWECDERSGVDDLHMGHVAMPILRGPNTYGASVPDTRLIAAAVNNLEALLDAADERDAARTGGIRWAIYEAGLWCGECDPADPDDDCCVVAPRIRAALATDTTTEHS
jgi:hypothetical protein